MEEFPKLVNSHDDSVIKINNSSFSIGRSLSCDHIIQSLGVSRFHCIIKKSDDKWTLFDRSTNGTFVNATLYKFNQSVDLKNGDVIKLGPDKLDFVFKTEAAQIDPNDESLLLVEAASMLEEFQEPFELEVVTTETPKTEPENARTQKGEEQNDMMENELTCSICSELFIKAVTLNCSHTYCKFCIEEWRKNKSNCPICRKFITTVAPTLVLDNFIDKFISTQSDEVKEIRKGLIQQREEVVGNTASSSSVATADTIEGGQIIEIFSEDDEDDDDSDFNYLSDDHDYDTYDCYFDDGRVGGARGRFYGGYGRCFICSQTGHWANSCPFKTR